MLLSRNMDKVYIDGPCQLLIRRSLDKLLDGKCFRIRKLPGPIVLQTFKLGNSRAQPYCIRTAPNGKSESRDSLSRNAQEKLFLIF